jgi:hypothetical protein
VRALLPDSPVYYYTKVYGDISVHCSKAFGISIFLVINGISEWHGNSTKKTLLLSAHPTDTSYKILYCV